jgi:hypothetical protein
LPGGRRLITLGRVRNPIRLKNLSPRFFPYYAAGILVLVEVRPTGPSFALGLLLILAGALLRGWGAGHLVKNDLLTISGPYAYLRHPLYAGTMAIGIGFAVMAGGWVPPVLLALGLPWFFLDYFPRKERVESERLEGLYGEAFLMYRRAVPALWPRRSAWWPESGFEGVADRKARWSPQRYLDNNELGTALALVVGLALVGWRITLAQ